MNKQRTSNLRSARRKSIAKAHRQAGVFPTSTANQQRVKHIVYSKEDVIPENEVKVKEFAKAKQEAEKAIKNKTKTAEKEAVKSVNKLSGITRGQIIGGLGLLALGGGVAYAATRGKKPKQEIYRSIPADVQSRDQSTQSVTIRR